MHWRRKWQPTRVLAWRIPGMEEPGGLPSVGSHRVRHDWSDLAAAEKGDREEKNKHHFQVKESSWMLMCEYPDPILPQFYMIYNTSIFCLVILGLPWGLNGRESLPIQETWVQSLGQEDPWEEEMAAHSSILAWEIPWTEEPGGLQSMGSQKSQTQLSD